MTPMEIYVALVLVFTTVLTFSILWKFKKMKEERAEMDAKFALKQAEAKARIDRDNERDRQRQLLRQHPNYGHPQFDPKNPDVLKPRESVTAQKLRYSTQSVQPTSSTTTVSQDSSNDLLNAALLWHMMGNESKKSSNVDDSTGYVPFTESTTQRQEPASSPSYSSSYSSSSDDSSSRSSYSSSYSSSSSDDSYSSSYSSSSDSSSSWSSSD